LAIFLDEGTATACGLDDGFGSRFDSRPPRIDVFPRPCQPRFRIIEVIFDGAATARGRCIDHAYAQPVQYACSCGISVWRQRGLDAPFEHQHTARMLRFGSLAGVGPDRGYKGPELKRHERSNHLPDLQQAGEKSAPWKYKAKGSP